MKDTLTTGLTADVSVRVDESLTVPAVSDSYPGFADMPRAFATAFMVGFAESTAMAVIADHLEEGESSVGVEVAFDHTAATPVGLTVTAHAELVEIDGRLLTFEITLRDNLDQIGQGTHRRALIDREKFDANLTDKQSRALG